MQLAAMIGAPYYEAPPIGAEMIRLLDIAMSEILTALIIWALIVGVRRAFKVKVTFRSVGLFLMIWMAVIVFHIIMLPSPVEHLANASPEPVAAIGVAEDGQDLATLLANKPQLQSIIRQVVGGSAVDQKTHDLFWSLIPASLVSTPEHRKDVVADFDKDMSFQKDFWESVFLSAQAHQIMKTQAYEDASRQAGPTLIAKSEAVLQAAASGAPYTFSNGQGSVVISEAYAKQVLLNLDASTSRLNKLFDPVWHP